MGLADAIEKGREENPHLDWIRGARFIDGDGIPLASAWPAAAGACALGFAELAHWNGKLSDRERSKHGKCPEGDMGEVEFYVLGMILHLNDDHGWDPERIVKWLRG